MGFAEEMRKAGSFTRTENGAVALNTTGDACLDFFSTAGSLREADEMRICALFAGAFREDPLFATKIVFYARDIRGGLGERRTFRILLKYMAEQHPEALAPNLDLVGVFGRYDDLYCLIGTPLEDAMWAAMKKQFEEDLKNLHEDKAISLLAKWIKTADASSEKTRKLGILTAQKLGYPVYNFKRIVRSMRKHIRVVECLMSANRWSEIKYSEVPSRAMMIYRKAFLRHDEERFQEFAGRAASGEEKINSAALYPYDIVEKIMYRREDSQVLEAQWKQLPDYVEKGTNAIVMADVSGSMFGRPMATSVGLAIYFAERNVGDYHDLFMTFSGSPQIVTLKGETLAQKINDVSRAAWGMNTSLELAFMRVLEIAVRGRVPREEMPKSIIVISDMEIDACGDKEWTFYEEMADRYRENGYEIPNVVFWNVNSRHDVFHADKSRRGVQLCSGQSVSVFRQLLACIGSTPVEMMQRVINSERYACITVQSADLL
ncbi:MAG: DUF2828 family protein [Lachnospiraceae bacterium]|nr:DUF2828 family protein [Lachnospiraceae bacterium]